MKVSKLHQTTGQLTEDPDLRFTASGYAICILRVAGETWCLHGGTGERASDILRKGDTVTIEGYSDVAHHPGPDYYSGRGWVQVQSSGGYPVSPGMPESGDD